jgi:hypothetical protein
MNAMQDSQSSLKGRVAEGRPAWLIASELGKLKL